MPEKTNNNKNITMKNNTTINKRPTISTRNANLRYKPRRRRNPYIYPYSPPVNASFFLPNNRGFPVNTKKLTRQKGSRNLLKNTHNQTRNKRWLINANLHGNFSEQSGVFGL